MLSFLFLVFLFILDVPILPYFFSLWIYLFLKILFSTQSVLKNFFIVVKYTYNVLFWGAVLHGMQDLSSLTTGSLES